MENKTPQTKEDTISQPTNSPTANPPQSIYPTPDQTTSDDYQTGMSASQMGLNQSTNDKSGFNLKKFLLRGAVAIIILGVIFSVLVLTNVIALSQFKTINYTNSNGTNFSLTFYTKHTTKTLKSGNTELVSKVSVDGKYPLTLSIASGDLGNLDKNGLKGCTGRLPKVFDVQNNSLNQQISVCSFPSTNGVPLGVYVMGFASNNQANIVTISQDLTGVDLSSQSGAQQSISKFGLDSYEDHIKKIVASIKVK